MPDVVAIPDTFKDGNVGEVVFVYWDHGWFSFLDKVVRESCIVGNFIYNHPWLRRPLLEKEGRCVDLT